MGDGTEQFTIGVEEEYQIVHPHTRELRSRAQMILPRAKEATGDLVQQEHFLSQIEIGTPICRTLDEVRDSLTSLRRSVVEAAGREGSAIAAAGTHPFSHWENQQITPKPRYLGIELDYQQLAREQVIFGCHVHIGFDDREAAIQVMNRARPWLAPLLALAANSPFWLDVDTGYSSYRTEIWRRWPMAGTPQVFASRAEYDALVETLVATESVSDASKIYWDVRPSSHYETLEFRVTDVCMTIDEAVMVAGLVRALARACHAAAVAGVPVEYVRPEVLRAAKWRAARYGLDADLVDVAAGRSAPAREVVDALLALVRPALEESGDRAEVEALVGETFARGTGAARQRGVVERGGDLTNVVDYVVSETAKGTS